MTIPEDAATLNFVFFYYEHCDNNERRDFKVRAAGSGGVTAPSC